MDSQTVWPLSLGLNNHRFSLHLQGAMKNSTKVVRSIYDKDGMTFEVTQTDRRTKLCFRIEKEVEINLLTS